MNNKTWNHSRIRIGHLATPIDRIRTSNMFVPAGYQSRVKSVKEFLLMLFVYIAILFMNGCTDYLNVALKTKNVEKGKAAVEKLNNPSDLAEVAIKAWTDSVRNAAVEKLSDQSMLAMVAMNGWYPDVCEAAVEKLNNPSDLAEVAMKALSDSVCKAAVEKLSEQSVLEKVAVEANSIYSRVLAIMRLTDQTVLGEIATMAGYKNESVGRAAVGKLTDQSILMRVAMGGNCSTNREYAVERITDPVLLAKIAAECTPGLAARGAAIEKLSHQAMLTSLADMNKDKSIQLLYKVIRAFDNVPNKILKRRLICSILPAIDILNHTEVFKLVGAIVSLRVNWLSKEAEYQGSGLMEGRRDVMGGERFTCSIKLQNLPRPLTHTWQTKFPPSTTSLKFKPAEIEPVDLLRPLFELLSQSLLAMIATEKKYYSKVREAAIQELNDQSILTEIILECQSQNVRIAAIQKSTDQSTLTKIALEDIFLSVREAAIHKLTDQSTLTNIAFEDKSQRARKAAIQKLTDQSLLSKITVEDKSKSVREAAQKRLEVLRSNEP